MSQVGIAKPNSISKTGSNQKIITSKVPASKSSRKPKTPKINPLQAEAEKWLTNKDQNLLQQKEKVEKLKEELGLAVVGKKVVEESAKQDIATDKRLEAERQKQLNFAKAKKLNLSKREQLALAKGLDRTDDEEKEADRAAEREFFLDEAARIEVDADGSLEIVGKSIKAAGKIKFVAEERASVHNNEAIAEHQQESDHETLSKRLAVEAARAIDKSLEETVVISKEVRERVLAEERVRILLEERKRLEEELAVLLAYKKEHELREKESKKLRK